MKWFTSRFSPDPSKLDNFSRTSSTKGQSEDEEVQLLFRKASQALAELRETPSIDFPLLNKATRLVQDVERGIAPLQSPDEKLAWQRCVSLAAMVVTNWNMPEILNHVFLYLIKLCKSLNV